MFRKRSMVQGAVCAAATLWVVAWALSQAEAARPLTDNEMANVARGAESLPPCTGTQSTPSCHDSITCPFFTAATACKGTAQCCSGSGNHQLCSSAGTYNILCTSTGQSVPNGCGQMAPGGSGTCTWDDCFEVCYCEFGPLLGNEPACPRYVDNFDTSGCK